MSTNIETYSEIKHAFEGGTPDFLYHYTSVEGLLGIVQKMQLWATHTSFLNDSQELELALAMVEGIFNERSKVFKDAPDSKEKEIIMSLPGVYNRLRMPAFYGSQIYVASLTSQEDQLSQWRGYCPLEGGYNIGVPFTHLRDMAVSQGYLLAPCIYDPPQQQAIINNIINVHMQKHINGEYSNAGQAYEEIAQAVAVFGPMLKHIKFVEEKEWRLISGTTDLSLPLFRAGKRTVIPYKLFKLSQTNQHDEWSFRPDQLRFTIGPTRDMQQSQKALELLCFSRSGSQRTITPSSIPFRG